MVYAPVFDQELLKARNLRELAVWNQDVTGSGKSLAAYAGMLPHCPQCHFHDRRVPTGHPFGDDFIRCRHRDAGIHDAFLHEVAEAFHVLASTLWCSRRD